MKSLMFSAVWILAVAAATAPADDAKKPSGKAADTPAKKLSFHRDIRPILRVHCQG